MKGYLGSKTKEAIRDYYETPKKLFKTLDNHYHFTTDVASSIDNHLCDHFYTLSDNALERDWGKVNWCNPPYSDITPWVLKAHKESLKGNQTVMLIPADTSVGWFQQCVELASKIVFIVGRISFINAETGKPANGNNKGSMLVIWDGTHPLHMTSVQRSKLIF